MRSVKTPDGTKVHTRASIREMCRVEVRSSIMVLSGALPSRANCDEALSGVQDDKHGDAI